MVEGMETKREKVRKYGKPPFDVAVIHGGPGAGGEMAPVARELAVDHGVLEPRQTATSIRGQILELRCVLDESGSLPVTLVGFSWGAWLSFMFAADYPGRVKKLIMVGSGPFEEKYAAEIEKTRSGRLREKQRVKFKMLLGALTDSTAEDKSPAFDRLGDLLLKTDAYAPVTERGGEIEFQADVFRGVWPEAARMRRSGELLKIGKRIKCPVVAIHGDYDPHPAEGVRKPLSAVLDEFRFVLLKNCGHRPWIEREAREEFYRILREELSSGKRARSSSCSRADRSFRSR